MLGWAREARECVAQRGLLQQVAGEDCVLAVRYGCETGYVYPRKLISSRFALVALDEPSPWISDWIIERPGLLGTLG